MVSDLISLVSDFEFRYSDFDFPPRREEVPKVLECAIDWIVKNFLRLFFIFFALLVIYRVFRLIGERDFFPIALVGIFIGASAVSGLYVWFYNWLCEKHPEVARFFG